MVVLKSHATNNVPIDFWNGIGVLKTEYGFSLDKLIINGEGSELNPEIYYAVMMKPS